MESTGFSRSFKKSFENCLEKLLFRGKNKEEILALKMSLDEEIIKKKYIYCFISLVVFSWLVYCLYFVSFLSLLYILFFFFGNYIFHNSFCSLIRYYFCLINFYLISILFFFRFFCSLLSYFILFCLSIHYFFYLFDQEKIMFLFLMLPVLI